MVARMRPVKGHTFFLEAAARVSREIQDARFILVGDGPLRHEIEDRIARLGISDRVHLLGERSDASQLVASFDLAVLASLHEGLPNAVMEAMAAGVPVVATAVGGTRELIVDGETGYLVPPADVLALGERISFALQNEEISSAIAERGREFVTDRFAVERMVESVESLYDELLRESKPRVSDLCREPSHN
jgi:glycosyltransferase involved in cell wall biosynthesis